MDVEGLVQQPAHQRHPPAAAVHRQGRPAELRLGGGQAAACGKRIAGRHHRPQQHGRPQRHPQQPEQDPPQEMPYLLKQHLAEEFPEPFRDLCAV